MYSNESKAAILSKTSPERDTLQETPDKSLRWAYATNTMFDYSHKRPLPTLVAQKAIDYISVLVKGYPFQLRYAMAQPLWDRFTEEWCNSGDERKALNAI